MWSPLTCVGDSIWSFSKSVELNNICFQISSIVITNNSNNIENCVSGICYFIIDTMLWLHQCGCIFTPKKYFFICSSRDRERIDIYKVRKLMIKFSRLFLRYTSSYSHCVVYHMQKSWECINIYAIMTLVINLHVFLKEAVVIVW